MRECLVKVKKFLFFIFVVFLSFSVSAISICIDHTDPSPPTNLNLIFTGSAVDLSWTEAQDSPECSGIDYYDIYRSYNSENFTKIASTNEIVYEAIFLGYGNYKYIIHSIDLVGHNEGNGILGSIDVTSPPIIIIGGGGGGGGGGSGSIFECGEWQECTNGIRQRVCVDLKNNFPNITESRSCIVELASSINNSIESKLNETSSNETTQTGFFAITGAAISGVTNFANSAPIPLTIGSLMVLILIVLFVRKRTIS